MSVSPSVFQDATIDDMWDDPTKFGMPTFAEFCANKEKWAGRKDDLFTQIDGGSKLLRNHKETKFEVFGYAVDTLEKAEQILKDEGYDISQCQYRPNLKQMDAGKIQVVVIVEPKPLEMPRGEKRKDV